MSSREPATGTFVFADIAGYTALTEAHGDADAAELAATFCGAISDVAAASGAEVIKTIGDAVMVRHSAPSEAVALGLAAAHESSPATDPPPCVSACIMGSRSNAAAIGSARP